MTDLRGGKDGQLGKINLIILQNAKKKFGQRNAKIRKLNKASINAYFALRAILNCIFTTRKLRIQVGRNIVRGTKKVKLFLGQHRRHGVNSICNHFRRLKEDIKEGVKPNLNLEAQEDEEVERQENGRIDRVKKKEKRSKKTHSESLRGVFIPTPKQITLETKMRTRVHAPHRTTKIKGNERSRWFAKYEPPLDKMSHQSENMWLRTKHTTQGYQPTGAQPSYAPRTQAAT
ncbi:hypothetical protein Tco_0975781 [Tanacetum coccineum]|uniref:Ribosomal protein S7 n=1 Tax=Tanacetum coccineum TaxID=301880 RepID=A0ABQ5EFC6_9ASTR